MEANQLASLYAEVVLGKPKERSRFVDLPDFDQTWDEVAAEVAAIRKAHPDARFDIPLPD